jgi:hypothetical protein
MERPRGTHNPREIRGCEAADRSESSVKKCHVMSRVMKMTLDTTYLDQVYRSGWQAILVEIAIAWLATTQAWRLVTFVSGAGRTRLWPADRREDQGPRLSKC